MKFIKKIFNIISQIGIFNTFLFYIDRLGIYHMNDEKYLKILYKIMLNKTLNLINPLTFNEKLQWLKLNDRKDVYTTMVDKYEAKKYVASMIGEEYIISTLGIPE